MKYPILCQIMPPDLLKQLLGQVPEEEKNIVLRTIIIDSKMRERRAIMGSMSSMFPLAGEKSICIFDSHNTKDVRSSTKVRCLNDDKADDLSANEAFDGLDVTYNFYENIFGRKSIDNNNMSIKGYVHWGDKYMNAFWDGAKMCYGDGDPNLGIKSFTASIDVMGHELTHGVTQYESGLEYWCDESHHPGALNESISDVFGSLIKQYALNQTAEQADWLIGQIFTDPNLALRNMREPGTARPNDPQPAHMRDYVNLPNDEDHDNGGVHINSSIPNKAFCLAAIDIGGYAWEKAGQIWYKALHGDIPTDCDFHTFAQLTLETSKLLFGNESREHRAVRKGWEAVGIRI